MVSNEVLKSAQTTVKSGTILTIGQVLSTLISFLTTLFVIKLLGEEQYGLYALVLVPISLIMLFCGLGVPPALTKYVAWFRARNHVYELKKILVSGFIFICLTGILLSIVTYILADPIAMFYQKPETAPLIKIVSLVLFAGAIYRVAWNTFLGLEKTKYNAAMLVINAIIKGGLALTLVLLGYGVFGAILGYLAGYFASATLGIIFVPREISKYKDNKATSLNAGKSLAWKDTFSLLLGFGFPLAIVNVVGGFGKQFYNFLAGKYCSKWDFGNYNAAVTLLIPLPVLGMPIMAVMFPAYSKIDGAKEQELLDSAFKLAVKYTALLIVPVAALIMGLSEPLKSIIFGGRFPDAPRYLMLLAFAYLFTPFGYLNFSSLFKGQGRTKILLVGGLLGLMVGIPASLVLIPLLGIIGLIFTNIVVTVVVIVFNNIIVKVKLGITIEFASSVKILSAGVFTAFASYFLQLWIVSYPVVELLVAGLVGFGVYVLFILVSGALTIEDVHNLKVIFRGIRPLRRVLKPHARRIEEILRKVLE